MAERSGAASSDSSDRRGCRTKGSLASQGDGPAHRGTSGQRKRQGAAPSLATQTLQTVRDSLSWPHAGPPPLRPGPPLPPPPPPSWMTGTPKRQAPLHLEKDARRHTRGREQASREGQKPLEAQGAAACEQEAATARRHRGTVRGPPRARAQRAS